MNRARVCTFSFKHCLCSNITKKQNGRKSIEKEKNNFHVWFVKISKMKKQVILAAVYIAERFELLGNFFQPQNPRFVIKSGFKSRAGYNGARTVNIFGCSIAILNPNFETPSQYIPFFLTQEYLPLNTFPICFPNQYIKL